MAGGLAALFDDVVALARLAAASVDDVAAAAAKATTKAAGLVVDDAAVTPRYVQGISPARELPVVWKIARGSIINKLVFILPAVMLLSEFLPWALTPLLMLGGTYLAFEGAEKIWELILRKDQSKAEPKISQGGDQEKQIVNGAVRTDFILSAEIMVISLSTIADLGLWMRLAALVVVAFVITAGVYGAVMIIVKMDDVGLALAEKPGTERLGRNIVKAMPVVMKTLSIVGVIAMLWVGGHILLVGISDLGYTVLYDWVHHLELLTLEAAGGFAAWLVNTFFSAVFGFAVGSVITAVMMPIHARAEKRKHDKDANQTESETAI